MGSEPPKNEHFYFFPELCESLTQDELIFYLLLYSAHFDVRVLQNSSVVLSQCSFLWLIFSGSSPGKVTIFFHIFLFFERTHESFSIKLCMRCFHMIIHRISIGSWADFSMEKKKWNFMISHVVQKIHKLISPESCTKAVPAVNWYFIMHNNGYILTCADWKSAQWFFQNLEKSGHFFSVFRGFEPPKWPVFPSYFF